MLKASARAVLGLVGTVQLAPKIRGGLGECGYNGSQGGGQQLLPCTASDPVPVEVQILPQSAAAAA